MDLNVYRFTFSIITYLSYKINQFCNFLYILAIFSLFFWPFRHRRYRIHTDTTIYTKTRSKEKIITYTAGEHAKNWIFPLAQSSFTTIKSFIHIENSNVTFLELFDWTIVMISEDHFDLESVHINPYNRKAVW